MVFEQVFANLLNTYLSEFIDDVSSNQLKLGAWTGKVELKNLSVKENALASLDLPFRVIHGHIGTLSATIPWTSIYTSPVILNLTNVLVLAVPDVESAFDPEKEQKRAELDKEKLLARIEEAMKTKATENADEKAKKANDDFVTKLATQIVKNVQVRVTNVHICYEDKFTNPRSPFTVGLTLQKVVFETQDISVGSKYTSSSPDNMIFKLMSLECVSMYWNSNSKKSGSRFISLEEVELRDDLLLDCVATKLRTPSHLQYILKPITFTANATINRKPEEDGFDIPLFDLDLILDEFILSFSRSQFESLLLLLDSINRMKLAYAYRKWRPSVPLHNNAKTWWTFVISAVLERDVRRRTREWSWGHIKKHRDLLKEYKGVYKQKLYKVKNAANLAKELEKQMDVFSIILIRGQEETEYAQEKRVKKQITGGKDEPKKGWFSWAFGTKTEEEGAPEIIEDFKREMTPQEKEKLYSAIGYGESDVPVNFPSEFVAHVLNVRLKSVKLSIADDTQGKQLVEFGLEQVLSRIRQRPSSNGLEVVSSIKKLAMIGCEGNAMIREESEGDLLTVNFELNPLESGFDYGVDVNAKGLLFIYDPKTVNSLVDIFSAAENVSLHQLEMLTAMKLNQLKEQSATGLEYAINQHKQLKVNLNLEPSFVIVPGGDLNGSCDALLLCLGHGKVTSNLVEKGKRSNVREMSKSETQEVIIETLRQNAYEKYNLSLTRMQIILSDSTNWMQDIRLHTSGGSSLRQLLDPVELDVDLMRCIVTDDPRLPKIKVFGEIPSIHVNASDEQLVRVMTLLMNIPVPEKKEDADITPVVYVESSAVNEAKMTDSALKVALEGVSEDETDTGSSGTSDIQLIELMANFAIKSVICDLKAKERLLIQVVVSDFGCSVGMETFKIKADLFLRQVLVETYDVRQKVHYLVETRSNEHLLRVNYIYLDKNGPEFKNLVQKIDVKMSEVTCSLDASIVGNILAWSQNIVESLPKSEESKVKVDERRLSISSLSSIGMPATRLKNRPKRLRKKSASEAVDMITLEMALAMENIRVNIVSVCTADLKGFNCSLQLHESQMMTFNAKWRDFAVINRILDERSLVYSEIVKSESDKVLELGVVIFPPKDAKAKTANATNDLNVDVKFGRLKVVFLNEFINKLLIFLSTFEAAKQRALEASLAAADYAKQSAKSAYESATKIGLSVCLDAPHIVVPRNWESKHCLLIDLGRITIENNIKTKQKALLDEIKLELTSTRISVIEDSADASSASANHMLEPISFALNVTRNLTFYDNKLFPEINVFGHLNDIELGVSQADLQLLMSILNENLGAVEDDPNVVHVQASKSHTSGFSKDSAKLVPRTPMRSPDHQMIIEEVEVHVDADDEGEKRPEIVQPMVYKRMKFEFSLPKIMVTLFEGEVKVEDKRLCAAYLDGLETYGEMLTDDTFWATLNVTDVVLCDARKQASADGIKQLMYGKIDPKSKEMGKIMRITVTKNGQEVFVDMNMSGFTLIFALDYLLRLSNVIVSGLNGPEDPENLALKPIEKSTKSLDTPAKSALKEEGSMSSYRPPESLNIVNFKMSKVDVVLIEKISNRDCPSIILNSNMDLNLKQQGNKVCLNGKVANIQLAMTNFKRYLANEQDIDAYILQPCELNCQAAIDTEQQTQHLDLVMDSIRLHISPNTVRIMVSILSAIGTSQSEDNANVNVVVERKGAQELFTPVPITNVSKYWFLNTNLHEAQEVTEDMNLSPDSPQVPSSPLLSKQQLFLNISPIEIVVESGGVGSQPLLKLQSSLQGRFDEWKRLQLTVTCIMNYYNEKLIAWEPIVEPLEGTGQAWSSQLKVNLNDSEDATKIVASLESPEQLELTVSKTALGVLSHLSESFGKAVKKAEKLSNEQRVVEVRNFMGIDLTLLIEKGRFFYDKAEGDMSLEQVDAVVVKSGAKLVLKSLLPETKADTEADFLVSLNLDGQEVNRRVSLQRKYKRCYEFPAQSYPGNKLRWIIDVDAHDIRSKVITFGTLVELTNNFHIPLQVYHLQTIGDAYFLETLEPNSSVFLPLNVVYSQYPLLFVKPGEDYCIPNEGISWKANSLNVESKVSILCCESKANPKTNMFIRVFSSAQPILYEDTAKCNSLCFKFEMNPTVKLRNLLPLDIKYCVNGKEENEVTLKQGESHDLVNFNPRASSIEIMINNYMNCDWSCNKSFPLKEGDEDEVSIWTFIAPTSDKTKQMNLALNLSTNDKESHAVVASLFAPFWMVNKTGLQIAYKCGESQVVHPANTNFPVLFSFKPSSFFAKKKISVAISNSAWSDSFSIDAVGNKGNVICKGKGNTKTNYYASVEITLSSFILTKIITFNAFYCVINRTGRYIDVSEDMQDWVAVGPFSRSPLWPKLTKRCELYFRLSTTCVSKPVTYKESNSTLLRIGEDVFNVLIDVTDSDVVVQLMDYYKGSAPVRIFNAMSDLSLEYGQAGVATKFRLGPKCSVYFTWSEPTGRREIYWSTSETEEMSTDLSCDAFGETTEGKVYWVTFLDGKQRDLMITKEPELASNALQAGEFTKPTFSMDFSMKGIGISIVNDELQKEMLYIGITGSDIMWEVKKPKGKRYKPLSMKQIEAIEVVYQKEILKRKMSQELLVPRVQSNVLSLLDNKMKVDFTDLGQMVILEPTKGILRRNSAHGLWAAVNLSEHVVQLHAKVHRVQIDNQMEGSMFGIIMCPVTPPKSLAQDRAPKAFVEFSTVLQRQANMNRFKYLSVLIQEFFVQIDGDFLMGLSQFAEGLTETQKETCYEKMIQQDLELTFKEMEEDLAGGGLVLKKNYYDLVHFSPIKVHVSFSLGGAASWQILGIFDFLIRSAGVTLTEFKDALFKIDYFERKNLLLSDQELISSATSHYIRQVLKQFYVIVLGLDVIGNPVGLVMGLGQGVGDLFYEPFMGIIEGPEEFAEGLALGVRSLFSHTVGGAAGALSKITGTIGEGFSTLTMDDEFIRRRRARLNKKANVAQSGKELARGFFSGLTGIITKPWEGAKEDGFEGLLKGIGRGAVGVIAQPATGVIDFASGSLGALKKAVDINAEAKKQRPARLFASDGILRPYNRWEASGNATLKELEKGSFAKTDFYLAHGSVRHGLNTSDNMLLMITSQHLILLKEACLFKNLEVEWSMDFSNIRVVELDITKSQTYFIKIHMKEERKILCVVTNGLQKNIFCQSMETATWLHERIMKAMHTTEFSV